MKSTFPFILFFSLYLISCNSADEPKANYESLPLSAQTISLLGDTLKTEHQLLSERFLIRIDSLSKAALEENRVVDHLIWEARKVAYEGDYRQAIQLYTDAIQEFPDEPRLYRHRGHRYITLRAFDWAIQDFNKAVSLFQGKKDRTEQDGLPNAENNPLSSLQTNTWYHLGLAHFLKGEFEKANDAFANGLQAADNSDMKVAFWYWKYMSLRKMGIDVEAGTLLDSIREDLELLENTSYYELLMVFKGVFTPEDLLSATNSELDNVTLGYGLGFWHDINGRHSRAQEIWKNVYDSGNWSAFGFIASEAELSKLRQH